jgi:hypothetical protein
VGTVLFHRSGATYVSPLIVAKVSGTPQAIGSTITYLRRYSLLAHLGLATEDDDGSTTRPPARQRSTTRPTIRRAKTSAERATARAMALFAELGYRERTDRLDLTGQILGREVGSWNDLDDTERSRVLDYLDREAAGPDEPEEDY